MTRSGSTLCFEYVRAALGLYRMPQTKLCLENLRNRNDNYIPTSDLKGSFLYDIQLASGDKPVAIKTHGRASEDLLEYIRINDCPVTVSVRDPRDILISLIEVGEKSRKEGHKDFSPICSFEDALSVLEGQVSQLESWRPLLVEGRAFLVVYEDLIKDPGDLLAYVGNALGKDPASAQGAKEIVDRAFTQFNKGVPGRGISLLAGDERDRVDRLLLDRLNRAIEPFWQYPSSMTTLEEYSSSMTSVEEYIQSLKRNTKKTLKRLLGS